jgi:hypothetical protein
MRDPIIKHRIRKEREAFIKSLDVDAICRIASSHHDGIACNIFRPLVHGAFNVCLFVEFEAPSMQFGKAALAPERWVVRIPIIQRISWADEKLEAEVATMK